MRRHYTIVAILIMFFFVVAIGIWRLNGRAPFTEATCRQLQRGMSRDDVIRVIGCSPGVYTDPEKKYVAFPEDMDAKKFSAIHDDVWCGSEGAIVADYDRSGLFWDAEYYSPVKDDLATEIGDIWLWISRGERK